VSEYRYHEFQAIDRPLSPADMSELRNPTSRATITAIRLHNVYHWGDFKFDPSELMGRYFDAFVNVANWGTHWLMLRLPEAWFDLAVDNRYAENKEREERIRMEIVVDANGPEEQATGWHVYLDTHLRFPFPARCVTERVISPLEVGDVVDVVGMAPEDECEHDMFVLVRRPRKQLGVPLAQLRDQGVDEETEQAIEDWRYRVGRGYQL